MSSLPPPGTVVAIYARYSTNLQTFKSIDDQIALCRQYAERHGWIVFNAFYDAERSGTTLVGRAGFFKLMSLAEEGAFSLVLTEDLDRISRTASDTHGIIEELEELDIQVCTVSNGIVTDMEVAFKATQNARYVKQLAEKTRRGQEGTVRSGRISGSISYGYRKVFTPEGKNGYREIVPEQAAIVDRVFREYRNGVSTMAICRQLNEQGVPGPRGKGWRPGALTGTKGSVTGILRNRLYIGEFHWGRTTRKRSRRQGKIKTRATPVSERVVQQMPLLRIIDDELFEAVQERLEARSAPNFNEHRHPEYLFTRKIYCSECGERLAVYNKRLGCTGHALKGTCKVSRRVSREALEQAVLDGLKEHLLAAELIEPALVEYRAEMERALAEQQSRSEFGVVRLRDIDRHIENVMSQIREGSVQGLGRKLLSSELERLEAERQMLERDIARKPRVPSPDLSAETIVERLRRLLDDLRGALEGKDREAVRARDLIRGMIERIVVTPLPGAKEDGRGAGPVSVKVEGRVAELLELAEIQLGRDIQHGSCPKTVQDGSIVTFFFDVVVPYENPRLTGVYADMPIISGLLDAAAAPVGKSIMMAALARERPCAPDDKPNELELRVRRATDHMRSNGKIRRIHLGPKTGWVWNHLPITDEQWRDRLSDPVFIPASVQEANLHTSGLEGHLAKLVGSAGPLNEAVGEDAAIQAEDHGMRRRARAKPDWAKRHSARAKLSAARNARGGRRE